MTDGSQKQQQLRELTFKVSFVFTSNNDPENIFCILMSFDSSTIV